MSSRTVASQAGDGFAASPRAPAFSGVARGLRRLVLGPAYSALMDALERPGSVNPRRVPDLVFQILDDSRPSSLNWLAARTICGLARTSFGRRRAEAIALHYDLPPEFYRIFLDSRYAAYTCGIFDAPGISLEEAQRRKFEILVRKLRPGPGDRIFELGSGWGAFLTFAKENGLNASGMALSREQIEHCHKRGLDVVYGDAAGGLPGPVDRLLAVGMFEHCKDKRGQILAECFRALKTGGRMVVQEMCSGAHPGEPAALAFAVEEFFHGDVLGDYHSVQRAARTAGFQVEHMECFGPHYVPTALEWARRLAEAFPAAAAMVGYRTAMSHLIAQAGFAWSFAVGSLDLLQYVLVKPEAGPSRRPHAPQGS